MIALFTPRIRLLSESPRGTGTPPVVTPLVNRNQGLRRFEIESVLGTDVWLEVPSIWPERRGMVAAPDSLVSQNILKLAPHIVANSLEPSSCLPIQLIDKVSESRNFFFDSQIAMGRGSRRFDA